MIVYIFPFVILSILTIISITKKNIPLTIMGKLTLTKFTIYV